MSPIIAIDTTYSLYYGAVTTRSFRLLLISFYMLAIGIPLFTALVVTLGPNPFLRGSKYLTPGISGLSEVRDRVAVIGWWALTGIAVILICRTFTTKDDDCVEFNTRSRVWAPLLILVLLTFLAGLTFDLDTETTDNWKRVELWVVIASAILFINVCTLKHLTQLIRTSALWLAGFVLLVFGVPTLFQSPATIRDNYHFAFTANELLAPAAGFSPMATFQAHYSNLLGFPIAPVIKLSPTNTLPVLVGYILFLQIICLAVPAVVSLMAKQRKLLLPMTLLPVALVTTANANGEAQHTYFQGFPLRSAMPSLLLLLLVGLLSRMRNLRRIEAFLLGGLASLTLINNLDFGVPAAIAALVTIALYQTRVTLRVGAVVFASLGAIAAFLSLWMAYEIFGETLDIKYVLLFLRVVSEGGYMNAAMPIGGLPIVIVTGFSLGTALGVYGLGRARRESRQELMTAAVFLLFSAVWGLLSTIYYSGRSFTSTALGGHSFQLGLVMAGVVLLVALDREHLYDQIVKTGTSGLVFLVAAIAYVSFVAASILSIPSPTVSMNHFMARGSQHPTVQYFIEEIDLLHRRNLLTESSEDIGLLLPLSNAIQQSGVGYSVLVTNHPQFAALMPEFARLQCQAVLTSKYTTFVEDTSQQSILDIPACREILGLSFRTEYLGDNLRVLKRSSFGTDIP